MTDTREPPARTPRTILVGVARTPFRDLYLHFLWMPWGRALALLLVAALLVNLLFATAYLLVGGVHGMRPTLADAFFFSVQTLATIGYGAMYPERTGAHVLVTLEGLAGLSITALGTGLMFAKFTLSSARISFARRAAIAPMNGVPTLQFRVTNERKNMVIDGQISLVVTRTERTSEGERFLRVLDLPLARARMPSLARTWTVMHPITDASPLHGLTPADFAAQECEFLLTVIGMDEVSMQPVHAMHAYMGSSVAWGMRPADMLSERDNGDVVVDFTAFHELVATAPQPGFPYANGERVEGAGDHRLDA